MQTSFPRLELYCFGVPTAHLDGGPAPPEVLRRKHLALLVYLALSPDRRRTRAHLVGVLWPETGEAQARHSLNEAIRRLRACGLGGDTAGALAAFHELATRLAELGEQPGRELATLAERIRGQRWRGAVRPHAEPEPALVGQERAHREAFTLVAEALRRGPQTLLITGDPGTGKTRLLTECAERFALGGGAVVAVATPLERDRDAPWSTLRTLLRSGLPRAPGSAAADPGALAVLATLAPQSLPGFATRVPADHAEAAAALASLLRALAEEQPVALAVDEAHCADGASIEALGGAMSQVAGRPLLLVLSARTTFQEPSRALVRLRSDVGRAGRLPGQVVQLEPLSAAETRELVLRGSAWCVNPADLDRLARRVFFETSGNPFLIVTMLQGLEKTAVLRAEALTWPRPGVTIEEPLPMSVPSLARQAVLARVAELDAASLQVLRAASIGALAVDPELIAALTGLAPERIEQLLAVLEHHGLLGFDGERYRFAAPLIAEVVRGERLLPGERRALRARAAAALASRPDLESRLLRAELMARTGPAAAAFAAAVAAAQAALAESAPRAARRALGVAERTLQPDDETGRRALAELRVRVAT